MADDEVPNAADEDADWGNVGEVGSDDDDYDMDDFVEDNEEESDNDNDDDDDDSRSDEEKMKNMESFIRTFHIGGYDVELDNALCYERGIIPLAHPTQASYNKPDNWRERNRIGLEEVKEQLQSCIDSVKHGESFDLWLTHPSDNEEPIVWHEPILDEYWDQLEAKMNKLIFMYIENVEMTNERLAALVAIFLNGTVMSSVIFGNANICGEGIISLSKLVEVSTTLQSFFIGNNRINNMESAHCLSRSLKSHARIRELNLPHCDLGSSPEILLVILQSDVSIINLVHNNIDSLGAVTIAEYLEGDPPIQRIGLDHNRLNDDDAIIISHVLKKNTNLKTICLHTNNLTAIGVKALLTCVFNSSSLNALSESNHTLVRMKFVDDNNNRQFKRLQGHIDRLLDLDRALKIVLALQDKDSLLQYLANVPVELIPEVLAFPLRHNANHRQHRCLNILYITMRWWNMPMLYSYHNCFK
jgi:hypothetical protein